MEKKKLLKNKIVDTLPMLYLETVILMVLGQFLGSFILGIPVGIAIVAHPHLGSGTVLDSDQKEKPSDPAGGWNKTTGK